MRPQEFAPPQPRFVTHVTDQYRGQTNYITQLIVDGKNVGYVEYSVYQDQPQIDMIRVDPQYRRQGYATLLVKELQRLYPDSQVKFGMLTPDGEKFHKSLQFEPRIDQSIEDRHQKLRHIRGELSRLTNKLEQLQKSDPQRARRWLDTVAKRWDKLHDLEYKYERETSGLGSSTKKFIREQ